jgi:decaprenyl-phosphate phosphoribosyltransferase
MEKVALYLKLTRPDNWIKNLLILPGFLLSFAFTHQQNYLFNKLVIGLIAVCSICSANYIINEWLDRESDKYHPIKKNRISVVYSLKGHYIFIEYFLLLTVGSFLSLFISISFLIANIALVIMGILYNVKPFRTKDIVYLDVLTESINNPIRLILGWLIVSSTFPPLTLLLSYWMVGAYVMTIKRYSELCFFQEPILAAQYRRSFHNYSSKKLLVSCLLYSICATFFWNMFIVNYKLSLIFLSPLYVLLFIWYLFIGFKPNSIAQHPEYIYKEKAFTFATLAVAMTTFMLLFFS